MISPFFRLTPRSEPEHDERPVSETEINSIKKDNSQCINMIKKDNKYDISIFLFCIPI